MEPLQMNWNNTCIYIEIKTWYILWTKCYFHLYMYILWTKFYFFLKEINYHHYYCYNCHYHTKRHYFFFIVITNEIVVIVVITMIYVHTKIFTITIIVITITIIVFFITITSSYLDMIDSSWLWINQHQPWILLRVHPCRYPLMYID